MDPRREDMLVVLIAEFPGCSYAEDIAIALGHEVEHVACPLSVLRCVDFTGMPCCGVGPE